MKGCLVIIFFLCLLGFLVPTSYAPQGDALLRFMKSKPKGRAADKSLRFATQIFPIQVLPQKGLKEKDRITVLPGQPRRVGFGQYGGYVTVEVAAGRALFYYFVEADSPKKNTMPLVLWLNGGPGCSSLGYGAMSELGPFRVLSDGKTLYENEFAWNKVANVLFLESPVGVGYSYANRTSEYNFNSDQKTAHDSYVFLLNWLERFPEYKTRDFYISGESYAGHFVSQLAYRILFQNKLGKQIKINLKGIIVGNAVLSNEDENFSSLARFQYLWSRDLIPDETFYSIKKNCNYSAEVMKRSPECFKAMYHAMNLIKDLNMYNIYAPSCQSTNLTAKPKAASIESFDPCNEDYVTAYLNRPEVQVAFHVVKMDHPWNPCSEIVNSTNWKESAGTVLPLIKEFMAQGIRVWVYSGDLDSIVSITSTKVLLKMLNLPKKTQWYPWDVNGETGGYAVEYKGGLTFASVRGAGHEVPSYQPRRALVLFKSFLNGVPLPKFVSSSSV